MKVEQADLFTEINCRHIKGHGWNNKHSCMEIIYNEDNLKYYLDNCSLTIFKYCPICGEELK